MIVKSLKTWKVFRLCSQVEKQLWSRALYSDVYFASTVENHGNEEIIFKYAKHQG